MIKKIGTLVKATIMQNHLGLNNVLLNCYKRRQIIHCKTFCSRQWAQMTLDSNKNFIIRFPKRNFFDQWKIYCKKKNYIWLKTCQLTKFYTPLICLMQNWSIIVFTVVWTNLCYFLHHLQLLSQVWTLQNASLQTKYNETKSAIFTAYT